MRTFHTGGIFTSDLSRQIISKVNGLLCYDPEIKVKLIRTLYGIYINSIERDAIFSIIDYFNTKNNIKLFADSLIFIKNKSFIKKGTLIAELINKGHQTITSKKDIIATHSGEIFFSLEKNIIWILEGNVYNSPRNSFFNKFNLNSIINFQDNLFSSKIINKAQGIITIKKDSLSTQPNSIQISNCLESFNHYPIFWEKKKKKLIILFQNKGKKKLYQLEFVSPNKEKKGIFFAQHLTNKYKTHTPGKIVLLDSNANKKNNYKNKIIRKNEKFLFIPIEIFIINKDKRFVFIKNNTKLKQVHTELISGIFSKTDGFIQIKESNQIIDEIEIKPGDYFEYLKLTKSKILELKKIDKKIYFPGEIIFEEVLIRYLTMVEIIKTKNSHSILLRPIEEFNIPKSKNQKKISFKTINKLKFDKDINEEVKIPSNLIDNQIWYENFNSTSVFFIYKLLKADKFVENNSFFKKIYFENSIENKINLTKKKSGLYSHKFNQEKKEIFYFSILDEEKFNINLFLPKKLEDDKLKISFFIKELDYIEKNTLIGKISIIPSTTSRLIQLKTELNENLKILLINRDNYRIYYNEIYPSFKTKRRFVLVNNKVAPLIKTNLSGKIELLKPFTFNLHKSTPFFITHSTKLYIRTGNFIKKDEILGIIIYEQIVTGDIVQGLPKIEEILEARKTKSLALLSNIPGIIKKIETISYKNNLTMIQLFGNTKNKNYKKFFKIRLTGIEKRIFIKKDQFIHLGQALTEGSVNPHNLLITYFSFYLNFTNEFEAAYLSFKNIQFLLIEKVQEVYITQGVVISNKHLEVILKQMTSKIQILRSSDTFLLPNEILELKQINYINEILKTSGRKKILFQPILLGITKASLLSDSFISASSFQETTKILTSAAIEGKIDWLRGLKENVIIGNIVPIGTGFEK
jgi:DNA-directed RNA polymerase subunit beta'